jgi:hypothetical protein
MKAKTTILDIPTLGTLEVNKNLFRVNILKIWDVIKTTSFSGMYNIEEECLQLQPSVTESYTEGIFQPTSKKNELFINNLFSITYLDPNTNKRIQYYDCSMINLSVSFSTINTFKSCSIRILDPPRTRAQIVLAAAKNKYKGIK